MKAFGYHKKEKLKSRTELQAIFTTGKSFSVFPIKVFFVEKDSTDTSVPVHAGVGVGSKHFKKAVDRNRIKRLLREAYRLEKQSLHEAIVTQSKTISVFFLYLDKELPDYTLVREKMKEGIEKLIKRINT
ncbi:MAG: ribonuclease P protein component [Sediminibacterium sp.]